MEAGNPLLDDYVLDLAARRASGRGCASCRRPPATPTTTSCASTAHFPASRCEPSHVSLFRRDCGTDDLRAHLLEQDLIYVGGGSVICLMGVLRAHGLDVSLREAWEAGVVLCGLSAGSLCWFAEAMTGYHGDSRPIHGPRPDPGLQRRALRQGGAPPPRLPPRRRRRDARRLRRRGRRRAALRRRRPRARCRVAAARRSPTASRRSARRSSSCRCRPATSAGPRRGTGACRLSPARAGPGACRRSSRWAAAASRWSRVIPRSTTTCARWRRRASRASACCRPRAATPRTRSCASTRRSATSSATRRTSPCSGSARARCRCASTCWRRT